MGRSRLADPSRSRFRSTRASGGTCSDVVESLRELSDKHEVETLPRSRSRSVDRNGMYSDSTRCMREIHQNRFRGHPFPDRDQRDATEIIGGAAHNAFLVLRRGERRTQRLITHLVTYFTFHQHPNGCKTVTSSSAWPQDQTRATAALRG